MSLQRTPCPHNHPNCAFSTGAAQCALKGAVVRIQGTLKVSSGLLRDHQKMVEIICASPWRGRPNWHRR
eukprot:3915147-Pyramimonas_sp.AAC.2